MWWHKNKWKVLLPVLIVAILSAAFWYGGTAPGAHGWTVEPAQGADSIRSAPSTDTTAVPGSISDSASGTEARPGGAAGGMSAEEKLQAAEEIAKNTSPNSPDEDPPDSSVVSTPNPSSPTPAETPAPTEPQDAAYTCTLSISCSTILAHPDWLNPEKAELVPEDGWILKPTTVTFQDGESVFDVLQRTCQQQSIHLEFENSPMYSTAYIEGIQNLYEFDCGELSGWMYKVNDWFPNYGCSRYQLQDGDTICWMYTCDLGVDVGGFSTTSG